MRIAALVIGIIAGLTGLSTATYGHAIFGLFSNNAKLLYLLPIATFVGAGLALSKPAPSAALMLGSGAIWFLIGANVGFGVNIFTIGAALLSGVAGALSAFAASQVYLNDFNSAVGPNSQRIATRTRQSATEYDRAKWDALVKYDPQIRDVVEKIRSELGSKWEDEFASAYLALNDKQYLPEMIRKIVADAKAEKEEQQRLIAAREKEEEELQRENEKRRALQKSEEERRRARFQQSVEYWKRPFWGTSFRRWMTVSGVIAVAGAILSLVLVNEANKASVAEAIRLEEQRIKSVREQAAAQRERDRAQRELTDQSQRREVQQRESKSRSATTIVLEREFLDKASYRAKIVISNVDLRYNGNHGQSHIWFGHIIDVSDSRGAITISTSREVGASVENASVEISAGDNGIRSEIFSALSKALSAWRTDYRR